MRWKRKDIPLEDEFIYFFPLQTAGQDFYLLDYVYSTYLLLFSWLLLAQFILFYFFNIDLSSTGIFSHYFTKKILEITVVANKYVIPYKNNDYSTTAS